MSKNTREDIPDQIGQKKKVKSIPKRQNNKKDCGTKKRKAVKEDRSERGEGQEQREQGASTSPKKVPVR